MDQDDNSSTNDLPSSPVARAPFVTTSWSMVILANDSDFHKSQPALSHLCEAYWYPLYAFVRRKGHSASDAEDLTQSFLAELLSKNSIARADQDRGKFRTFLLASFSNFLKNAHRNGNVAKRGGGAKTLSLDFELAEDQFGHEPSEELTPEKIFDRNWALALLQQVLSSLRQQYVDSGKTRLFDALQGQLAGESSESYKDIAAQLNMKEGAIKVAVHRMRERYGQQLRLQIAKTTASPELVEEELGHLFQSLSG